MTKIATLLLQEPSAPLDLSITELAKHAGTSPATVTRFCRMIGYEGYVPFRVAVAADIGRGSALNSWRADIGRSFEPDDSPAEVIQSLVAANALSVQTTADSIDIDQITTVAETIAKCRHLDIYGTGGSGVMAAELANRLYRIGIPVHAWQEVHAALASAAIPRDGSMALAISNTGHTNETIEALALARSVGATTVAISGSARSPLAEVADIHIVAAASDGYLQPDDLAAKHAQLFVIDLIYLLVAQHNFGRAATMLAASAMAVSEHRRGGPAAQQPAQQHLHAVATTTPVRRGVRRA